MSHKATFTTQTTLTNHDPLHNRQIFGFLFLILNPKYVHVFKSAILFSILNPTYESMFQIHQTNGATATT
jgi:hypothetical protein